MVGGVAANSRVRALAQERCDAAGIELRVPPMRLCTDNGAMIAAIGDLLVRDGARPSPPTLGAIPTIELTGAQLDAVGSHRPEPGNLDALERTVQPAWTQVANRAPYNESSCRERATRTSSRRAVARASLPG